MEKVPITYIKANPNNPRLIKDDKFIKLVKSIAGFPEMLFKRPLICVTDTDGKLYPLGGNMRLKAIPEALKLMNGKAKLFTDGIPVELADEWTEEQRREFVIKDNVGFGEWDWDLIANEWDAEQLTEWGLDIPDFKVEQEAQEDDYEIPDEIQTDIVLGDLFEIGLHRLLCGDSTDSDAVDKLMNGKMADMIFTDPPYGVNYTGGIQFTSEGVKKDQRTKLENDDSEQIYADSIPMMASITNGPIYTWFAGTKAGTIYNTIQEVGEIHALIIWVKNGGYGALNANYKQKHEPCLYWKPKGGKLSFCGDTTETTIWEIDKDGKNKMHPTQKPVALAARAIKNHSVGLIADLFLGSGTTMVAAHQLNRKCYGMELDPKYCQVIVDRMLKLDPSLEIKRNREPYKSRVETVSNAAA